MTGPERHRPLTATPRFALPPLYDDRTTRSRCLLSCTPVRTGAPANRWTTDGNSLPGDRPQPPAGDRDKLLAGAGYRALASKEVGVVAEGALAVVCLEGGGQVEVYHSRWAGGDSRLRRVLHAPGDPLDALCGAKWQYRGRRDRTAFPGGVDTLGLDAVYLLPGRGVRVYLPVWLGMPETAEQTGRSWAERATNGLLLHVDAFGQCRRLRGMVRFLKSLFCVAVRRAWIDRETARNLLALALRSDHTPGRVHTPGAPL